ncbi:MAG: hypothetical protein CMJ18_14385 [Phycisphaeraceae bacterium]|nr:hypothetical protein [Phycisphaeraceae bacterium]
MAESDSKQDRPVNRRWIWAGGLALLVVAAGMRFVDLDAADPWEDEVYTYIGSGDLIPRHLAWEGHRANLHSPLMYVEVKIFRRILGDNIVAARTPAALYGTAAVLLLYMLIGTSVSWSTALACGLALAVHPFAVEWGREARMYSHWLTFSTIATALTLNAVAYASRPDGSPFNWRWWALGFVFMYLYALVIFSVTTIAAIAIGLGVMALAALPRRRRAALVILAGSALSGVVYLHSWALTGIGRMLLRMSHPGAEHETSALDEKLRAAVKGMFDVMGGYLPSWAMILFWFLAVAGLVILVTRGHWRLVMLLALIGGMTWITFPSIAERHFYTPRYLFVMLLPLCVGFGAAISLPWLLTRSAPVIAARIGSCVVVLGVVMLWGASLGSVMFEPRIAFHAALAPLHEHAQTDDVLIMVPEWYIELNEYYDFADRAEPVLAPADALYYTSTEDELHRSYADDFETRFDPAGDRPRPPGAWVLLVEPEKPFRQATPVQRVAQLLSAYGRNADKEIEKLAQAARGAATLTFRVSAEGIEHLTATHPRRVGPNRR